MIDAAAFLRVREMARSTAQRGAPNDTGRDNTGPRQDQSGVNSGAGSHKTALLFMPLLASPTGEREKANGLSCQRSLFLRLSELFFARRPEHAVVKISRMATK